MDRNYVLGLYEKAMPAALRWEEKLLAAKAGGFDFVEISIDETDAKLSRLQMSARERADLVACMQQTGIPIRSMCLSGHRKFPMGSHHTQIRARSMEIMKEAIDLADDLGVRIIQLAGYDVYYEEGDAQTRAYFTENLQEAARMAAKRGIMMGFETMETPFMNTAQKAMEYVKLVDSPYLQVYPDIGNITNAMDGSPQGVCEDLKSARGHIIAVHLKETKPGLFRDLHFGEGYVDFETLINKTWELGVRRYVTEFWYHEEPDWQEQLTDASTKMRRILDAQEEK